MAPRDGSPCLSASPSGRRAAEANRRAELLPGLPRRRSPQWRRWCGRSGEPCWAAPRPCSAPSEALATAAGRCAGQCGPASPCRCPRPWQGSPGPSASGSPRSASRWIGGRKNEPCSGSTTTWGSWVASSCTRSNSSWGPCGCEAGGGTSCRGAFVRRRWWEIGCLWRTTTNSKRGSGTCTSVSIALGSTVRTDCGFGTCSIVLCCRGQNKNSFHTVEFLLLSAAFTLHIWPGLKVLLLLQA